MVTALQRVVPLVTLVNVTVPVGVGLPLPPDTTAVSVGMVAGLAEEVSVVVVASRVGVPYCRIWVWS